MPKAPLPYIAIVWEQYDNSFVKSAESACNCDCACTTSISTEMSSPPLLTDGLCQRSPTLQISPLVDQYSLVFDPFSNRIAVINQEAEMLLNNFISPQNAAELFNKCTSEEEKAILKKAISDFVSLGFIIPPDKNLPVPVEYFNTLTAWLHITDRCNLRCDYCYLPHLRKDMSLETGRSAIAATFRSAIIHNYQEVKFKYAGGEALICFPLVTKLHHYAQTLAEYHSLSLNGVVLSNGTLLTSQIVQTMQSLGLRLMLSLDGLGDFHDRQRFYAGGRGSADDVARAIEIALDQGLVPDISITVTGRNAEGLPELMAWVLERNLPFSLNFYRENELSTSYADLKLEEEKIINSMLTTYRIIEANIPRHSLLASLVDRANLSTSHLHTCGVGHSYLVFDYRGRVSKCQMEINRPVTTIQVDDPLAVIQADTFGIQNMSVEEKEGCRSCEWKYWCTGGCPLATFKATGRYDVSSPNCNIYKALYPAAIRLEGLRLLKHLGSQNSSVHNQNGNIH